MLRSVSRFVLSKVRIFYTTDSTNMPAKKEKQGKRPSFDPDIKGKKEEN